MVLIQLDLDKQADKNLKVYMALNEVPDKRIAINEILNDLTFN